MYYKQVHIYKNQIISFIAAFILGIKADIDKRLPWRLIPPPPRNFQLRMHPTSSAFSSLSPSFCQAYQPSSYSACK